MESEDFDFEAVKMGMKARTQTIAINIITQNLKCRQS